MTPRRILVATDFSTRSDRALRRAVILAKAWNATLALVHVIDYDQPQRIVQAERAAASSILADQARAFGTIDGLQVDTWIVENDPFEGIMQATRDLSPDLLLLGPHRRHALRDVFLGTTAERAIHSSNVPVLMANGVPAAGWHHVLAAVDLSPCSAHALRTLAALGLAQGTATSVLHAFDAGSAGVAARASMDGTMLDAYLSDQRARARAALDAFLAQSGGGPFDRLLEPGLPSVPRAIIDTATRVRADLLVIGTRGAGGVKQMILGSVAQSVLGHADIDVLAVPPNALPDAA